MGEVSGARRIAFLHRTVGTCRESTCLIGTDLLSTSSRTVSLNKWSSDNLPLPGTTEGEEDVIAPRLTGTTEDEGDVIARGAPDRGEESSSQFSVLKANALRDDGELTFTGGEPTFGGEETPGCFTFGCFSFNSCNFFGDFTLTRESNFGGEETSRCFAFSFSCHFLNLSRRSRCDLVNFAMINKNTHREEGGEK